MVTLDTPLQGVFAGIVTASLIKRQITALKVEERRERPVSSRKEVGLGNSDI
jgi:hypothetical protein